MMNKWTRRGLLPFDIILSALLFSSSTTAESYPMAVSPVIEDGLVNRAPTTCPVAQDGYTYNTFPWTHEPVCVDAVISSSEGPSLKQTFCAYTNVNYNNGRGVSFVVTPETAASITFDTYGMAIGGLEGQIGEEMGMWEVNETKNMGKGLFAKKDIGAIFAGESIIVKTPVLFVARQLLETDFSEQSEIVWSGAMVQLPGPTKQMIQNLAKSWGGPEAFDITKTNAIEVKWPWVNDMPVLLSLTPEIARINHACRPNAAWRFNDYTLAFDLFALKEIKPGEEITISYGYEMRAHRRRMKSLEANHNFQCVCSLCTASEAEIEASNDRLSEIKALKSVLPSDTADSPQLLGLLHNLIKLYDDEDLHTETPMYEEILALTFSSFGIAHRAKYWAGRAKKHWAVLLGQESWEAKRCGDLEDDVRMHATWKSWKGEPYDGYENGHDYDHAGGEGEQADEDGEDLSDYDQRPERDQFRGHI
ncbi:hypothetical protein HBI20_103840 [Parastagonospora nodorum]|nr:hypothetical protein HBI20_103840 [Parastagonospora nodorum]